MSRFPAIRRRYKTETRDLTPAQAPETRDPVAGATTKIRPRSRGRIAWHGKISLEKGVHSMTKRVTLRRRSLDFEERVDEVRTKCRLSRRKKGQTSWRKTDFVEKSDEVWQKSTLQNSGKTPHFVRNSTKSRLRRRSQGHVSNQSIV